MTGTKIKNEIAELGPWYQIVDFGNGIKSPGLNTCGESLWLQIRKYLPKNLVGIRILDLGCNAGIYCIRAALEGAEGVGIEPAEKWWRQTVYVRKHFEKIHGKLNIRFIQNRMENISENLGKFDVVLAASVLYYIRDEVEQERMIKWICSITNNVVARFRGKEKKDKFNAMFGRNGAMVIDISAPPGKTIYYLVNYKV